MRSLGRMAERAAVGEQELLDDIVGAPGAARADGAGRYRRHLSLPRLGPRRQHHRTVARRRPRRSAVVRPLDGKRALVTGAASGIGRADRGRRSPMPAQRSSGIDLAAPDDAPARSSVADLAERSQASSARSAAARHAPGRLRHPRQQCRHHAGGAARRDLDSAHVDRMFAVNVRGADPRRRDGAAASSATAAASSTSPPSSPISAAPAPRSTARPRAAMLC